MRRTLRLVLCQCLVAGLALPLSAAAQETRGKISGTVRDAGGVIPGASVRITNSDTSVSQNVLHVGRARPHHARGFGGVGRRPLQVRFDAQNVFNRQQWLAPTLNPTSTQFGRVTTVALNQMRFFSFGVRGTF